MKIIDLAVFLVLLSLSLTVINSLNVFPAFLPNNDIYSQYNLANATASATMPSSVLDYPTLAFTWFLQSFAMVISFITIVPSTLTMMLAAFGVPWQVSLIITVITSIVCVLSLLSWFSNRSLDGVD